MDTIQSTRKDSLALTTSPTKVWSTNQSRVGIEVKAPSSNTSNILLIRVPANASAPTLTQATADVEIAPGGLFEGDNRWNGGWDVYAAVVTGSGTGNFKEIQN